MGKVLSKELTAKKIAAVILIFLMALLPVTQLYAKSESKGTPADGKKQQGYGVQYDNDSDRRVEGYWVNDVMQGPATIYMDDTWGKVFFHDGEPTGPVVGYDGEEDTINITNDLMNGLGIVLDKNGDVVETGLMKEMSMEDELVSWKAGSTTYYAENKAAINDGNAIAVYGNKNVYIGAFKNQKQEGRGVCYYSTGSWYDGNWKAGKMEGEGIYYLPYSESTTLHDIYYKGVWEADKLQGAGVIYRSDNSRVIGRMKDGRLDGISVTVEEDGKMVFSEWENGKEVRNNIETWKADNGVNYVGEKSGNTINGYGACIYKDGMVSVGNFVKGVHEGEVYVFWPVSDSYFDGHYKNGKYSGEGAVYYRNGNYFKGTYDNGEWAEGTYYYYGKGWYEGTFKSGQFDTGSYTEILQDGSTSVTAYKDGKKADE